MYHLQFFCCWDLSNFYQYLVIRRYLNKLSGQTVRCSNLRCSLFVVRFCCSLFVFLFVHCSLFVVGVRCLLFIVRSWFALRSLIFVFIIPWRWETFRDSTTPGSRETCLGHGPLSQCWGPLVPHQIKVCVNPVSVSRAKTSEGPATDERSPKLYLKLLPPKW